MKNKQDATQSVRKGFMWDLAGSLIKQLTSVLISIILARLLGPKDFGLIGMALVFISLSDVFVDVGFTSAIIQAKEMGSKVLSSIFFMNLGISIVFTLLTFLCAPLISDFFGNPELTMILRYLILIIPIYALGRVQAATLMKSMNFKSLALRDIFATLTSGLIGVVLAFNGYGVKSLVIQQFFFATISTALLWKQSIWRPKFEFAWIEIKELMSFSSFVFFDELLQQFFKKIDTLFVGKVFSPTILGFYSRAESFNSLINNYSTSSLNKVIYPLLSSIQHNKEKFADTLSKSISLAVFATTGLVGFLFFTADFLIILLLGPKWALSVVLFKILIFNTVTLSINSILNKAILSKGYSKLKFKVLFVTRILYLFSMPFGYYYGVEAFAIAFVAIRFITISINWIYFKDKLEVNLINILKTIMFPLGIMLFWVGVYYSGLLIMPNYVYLILFLLSYFIILYIVKNSGLLFTLNEIQKLQKKLQKTKK